MVKAWEKKGFSLIELLVVIAILSILVGLITVAVVSAQDKAKRVACARNLSAINTALAVFASNNNGAFPRSDVMQAKGIAGAENDPAFGANCLYLLVQTTDTPGSVFKCPATQHSAKKVNRKNNFDNVVGGDRYCSYAYDPRHNNDEEEGDTIAIMGDRPGATLSSNEKDPGNSDNHKGQGQNVLFLSGSVRWFESAWVDVRFDGVMDYLYTSNVRNDENKEAVNDIVLVP